MLLAGVMVVAAACGGTTGGQENAAVSGDETNEESADETRDAEKSDAKSLEERLEIEKPWINSNILGTVTDDYAPSEQEDYYVAANHDWLVDAELPAGYSSTGAAVELMLERDEQIQGLMTDDSLTGHDAELIQNLYELWLDWDSRNAFDRSIRKNGRAITPVWILTERLITNAPNGFPISNRHWTPQRPMARWTKRSGALTSWRPMRITIRTTIPSTSFWGFWAERFIRMVFRRKRKAKYQVISMRILRKEQQI